MNFYLAPLEGITGYIYRNAQQTYFQRADKYFTPFISPNQKRRLNARELNDILPAHNEGLVVVPQILTNDADAFVYTATELSSYGYDTVNLNLGCPSGTVVSKHKGAGFLACPKELNRFLEAIFTHSPIRISIKTRIGKDSPEEFYQLIEIFNQYPIQELIIHPRIQADFYKNKPRLTIYRDAISLSTNPLCYNGDIFTLQDYQAFTAAFPETETMMLGRGLLMYPGLLEILQGGAHIDYVRLQAFHDKVYWDYQTLLSGGKNVLFKMKELWSYMIHSFPNADRHAKQIRKSNRLCDYEEAVRALFHRARD